MRHSMPQHDSKLVDPRAASCALAAALLMLVLTLVLTIPCEAQGQSQPQAASGEVLAKIEGPRVVDAFPEGQEGKPPKVLPLDSNLVVQIDGLAQWLGAEGLGGEGQGCYSLRLYLDGRELEKLRPERCLIAKGQIVFQLHRIDRAGESAWAALLEEREGLSARVDISVGEGNKEPIPTEVRGRNDRALHLVANEILVAASFILLAALVAFLWLSAKTSMLRRAPPGESGFSTAKSPFSLARVQIAWWFFLVLGSFLFLSVLVGDIASVPSSVLGLMSIAAGTYLGAEVIDNNRKARPERTASLSEAKEPAQAQASALPPALTTSRGLLTDILSDPGGIAFHRFQIFVWTIVLGILFIAGVWRTLAMPDVPSGLLGLMGISGGTHLGIKLPEAGGER